MLRKPIWRAEFTSFRIPLSGFKVTTIMASMRAGVLPLCPLRFRMAPHSNEFQDDDRQTSIKEACIEHTKTLVPARSRACRNPPAMGL